MTAKITGGDHKRVNHNVNIFDPDETDYGVHDSVASLETIDAFVGPVKEEFNELKRKIEEKDKELEVLQSEYYKGVSAKSMELEGIGPE